VYELCFDPGASEGHLVREDTTADQLEMIDAPSIDPADDSDLHAARLESVEAMKALLSSVYHVPPAKFSQDWDDEKSISFIQRLIDYSKYYDCRSLVKVYTHIYLRQHHDDVLRNCWRDPWNMLLCGISTQYDLVVMESCAWMISEPQRKWAENYLDRLETDLGVLGGRIIEQRETFQQRLKDIDLALLRIQAPGDGFVASAATNHFRRWIVGNEKDNYDSRMGIGYGQRYRDICDAYEAFDITKEQLVRDFAPVLPKVSDALLIDVRSALRKMTRRAAKLIKPILEDVTACGQGNGPARVSGTLRFTTIEKEDLPWNEEQEGDK